MNNQEIVLTRKLLSCYKKRLENEIIKRSNKLRIPQKISQEILNKNDEIIQLNYALDKLNKDNSNS